ncbi:MAG: hypothetical protein M3362_26550 [Acidobacteriota bacterium]|nr:hypothetical protein [Acidobacteriota bacterium]
MSKKQQPNPTIVNNYAQDRTAAQTVSPYEQAVSDRNNAIIKWGQAGDYRQPPKGVFFDFTNPAYNNEKRQLLDKTGGQGILALGGGGDASLLAMNKQNLDDQFARDTAENYQHQVQGAIEGAYGNEGKLMDSDLQRRLSIYGTSAGLYNSELGRVAQANSRPSWW